MIYFTFLTLAGAMNAIGYMYEVSSTNLDAAIIACKVMYLGSPFIGPLYLMFALDYINKPLKKRWLTALIFIPAAVFSIAVFAYPGARVYYSELGYSTAGWQPHLAVTPGPLYYPCFIYEFALVIAGAAILIYGFMRDKTRNHTLIFLVSAVLPMSAQIINFTGVLPGQMNTVPAALTATIAMLSWYLARYRRLEWQSLGRELVVQNMNDAFILIDANRQILDSNDMARRYFPELTNARPGTQLSAIPGFPAGALAESGDFDFDLRVDGVDLFLHLSSTALKHSGASIGACLLIYNNTVNHLMMAELSRLAHFDDLTGLNNRTAFFRDAKRMYELCRRQRGYPGSALMMDIDYFKKVNDTYGHAVGDDVLRRVGALLNRRVRRTDICGRYGGEELCLWLPSTNTEGSLKVAEDVRAAVENMEFSSDKGSFKITVSIGVASADGTEPLSFEDVVKRADEALYNSKRAGRNRVSVYDGAVLI
jgi:diguanylate cyclase (GGDEF)-like protein